MWTESQKGSRLHRGVEQNGRVTEATRLITLSGANGGTNVFTRTVWMEANNHVIGTVDLYAKPVAGTTAPTGLDKSKMTGINIDLDADTNRDGNINDTDEANKDEWTNLHGAIILYNGDNNDSPNDPYNKN